MNIHVFYLFIISYIRKSMKKSLYLVATFTWLKAFIYVEEMWNEHTNLWIYQVHFFRDFFFLHFFFLKNETNLKSFFQEILQSHFKQNSQQVVIRSICWWYEFKNSFKINSLKWFSLDLLIQWYTWICIKTLFNRIFNLESNLCFDSPRIIPYSSNNDHFEGLTPITLRDQVTPKLI